MKINEKTRLFLVGYMGAGKTTIGKMLAKKLNWSFADTDYFIENRYRQSITTIFEERGEACFREIEHRALVEICNFEKIVVSTGGGLPCFFDNMDLMNQTGITIYLKESVNGLVKRLNFDRQKRPLIKGKKPEELQNFVETSLKKRESFYNKATIVFDAPFCSTEKEINHLIEKLLIHIS